MTAMRSAQRQVVQAKATRPGSKGCRLHEKKALSEDRAGDWAEAKSKVGQRAREEDMRSADEPGSREEDTIPVQCRDTGSEGGGYGAAFQRQGEI